MTVPDDEKFLSKQVRARVREVWQHRFIVSNVLASHLVGALVIVRWHASNRIRAHARKAVQGIRGPANRISDKLAVQRFGYWSNYSVPVSRCRCDVESGRSGVAMRTVVAQFFRRIPGAVGLNATVAFGSAAAFLLSYELLVLVKMFGPIRWLQIFIWLAVLAGTAWLFPRMLRSLWRRFKSINTAKRTGF